MSRSIQILSITRNLNDGTETISGIAHAEPDSKESKHFHITAPADMIDLRGITKEQLFTLHLVRADKPASKPKPEVAKPAPAGGNSQ